MRVLYINLTEKISGGEKSLLYYLAELKHRIVPIVVCPKKGPLTEQLESLGIKYYTFPIHLLSKYNPFPFLFSLFKLIDVILKEQVTIIHANGMSANQITVIAAKLTRRYVILHLQNFVEKEYFYKYLFFCADRIIVPSAIVQKSLLKYLKKKNKSIVMRHAVPLLNFAPKKFYIHDELKIPHSTKIVALIGLIEERKGHEYFIRAAEKIKIKAHFIIVGDSLFTDDTYKKTMMNLVHTLKLSNVSFLGHRTNIPAILNDVDVVVVPSLNEPLGLIVLEAGAMSIPVVGFDCGGIPEMIEDGKTGFLVPERNNEKLAEKISMLLRNNSMRKKIGLAARDKVRREFNVEKNVERILAVYGECI